MLKGLVSYQYYSGQKSEDDNSWLQIQGKVVSSCRHNQRANLICDTRVCAEVRAGEEYSQDANALFSDFLSLVTTKAASAVVRSHAEAANGCEAWKRLYQLRRDTGCAYFIKQIKCMMAQAAQLGVLSNPLSHSLRQSRLLAGALALPSLHPKILYIQIKTTSSEKLPTSSEEEATCGRWDNIYFVLRSGFGGVGWSH
ncbi:hypothetical protein CYMTET_21731 [Cymbomonas tetramitiformis]|uniref:Uncharacterized protein n=1 Tax=Cymbomonas tetramitiformis TaxID=36881 RepID=A0AAE0G1J6_9CHLO|nr:hypothetical protein CYMTET_21731 [Cymbomonas tetramitiformis]